MEKHENYSFNEGLSECDGCPLCDPEKYTTTVDISFLEMCQNMFRTICEISPDRTAPGWLIDIEEAMYKTGAMAKKPPYLSEKIK